MRSPSNKIKSDICTFLFKKEIDFTCTLNQLLNIYFFTTPGWNKSILPSIMKKMKVYDIFFIDSIGEDLARYVTVLPICVSHYDMSNIHNFPICYHSLHLASYPFHKAVLQFPLDRCRQTLQPDPYRYHHSHRGNSHNRQHLEINNLGEICVTIT